MSFPKEVIGFESWNFSGMENFQTKFFHSSRWIKCQKMVRIMKKDACEICINIEKVILENQFTWISIDCLSTRGWGWRTLWGVWGTKYLTKTWSIGGPSDLIFQNIATSSFLLRFQWKLKSFFSWFQTLLNFLYILKKKIENVSFIMILNRGVDSDCAWGGQLPPQPFPQKISKHI